MASSPPAAADSLVGSFSLTPAQLAGALGGTLRGNGSASLARLAGVEEARTDTLTFVRTAHFAEKWAASPSPAAIVSMALADHAQACATRLGRWEGRALIVVPDADAALTRLLAQLAPSPIEHGPAQGVDPSASVDPSAHVHPSARVGPGCVVGAHASIEAGAILIAQVYVGPRARVGVGCLLYPQSRVLERCVLGARCILHCGATIGADGFGYHASADGRGLTKIPHIGIVELGDDVEIGANACIDRAKFGATSIGAGTKIDNLVQIGHNVTIGRCCIICGNAGISGSVTVGDGVVIGGGAGIADGLRIGSGAKVAAAAGVTGNVPAGETYMGTPAMPLREARRMLASLLRLGKGVDHVRREPGPLSRATKDAHAARDRADDSARSASHDSITQQRELPPGEGG